MSIIYTYRWNAQFPLDAIRDEALSVWLTALNDLTVQDIKRGIDVCARSNDEYIPSLGEFRNRCFPSLEELNIPYIDEAWEMANNQDWKHPIIWHAVTAIGTYEFKHGTYKDMQKHFAETYSKLVQRARQGEIFMMPSNPQLPPPDKRDFKKSDPETAKEHLERMREVLKVAKHLYGKTSDNQCVNR